MGVASDTGFVSVDGYSTSYGYRRLDSENGNETFNHADGPHARTHGKNQWAAWWLGAENERK